MQVLSDYKTYRGLVSSVSSRSPPRRNSSGALLFLSRSTSRRPQSYCATPVGETTKADIAAADRSEGSTPIKKTHPHPRSPPSSSTSVFPIAEQEPDDDEMACLTEQESSTRYSLGSGHAGRQWLARAPPCANGSAHPSEDEAGAVARLFCNQVRVFHMCPRRIRLNNYN